MIRKLKDKIERHLREVIELKTSPHSIAMGFALGTFVTITPTFGLGLFICLGLLFIFKKVSKISMFISFLVWNPITLALMYPLNYSVGNFIFADVPVKIYEVELLNQLFIHSRRFIVGSTINAAIISMTSYVLVLYFSYRYQRKKIKGIKEELVKLEETLKI
ncbi:MAG: DUF2062 domain-containing protein [archaeon]